MNNTSNQTKITPYIKNISVQIAGEKLEYVINVLAWLCENLKKDMTNKDEIFRKRTADQILVSGFSTGCTDTALVFLALMRVKNIEAYYLETIDREWLKHQKSDIRGHVFCEILLDDKHFIIDPIHGNVHVNNNIGQYKIIARGLDSWDIEARTEEDIRKIIGDNRY